MNLATIHRVTFEQLADNAQRLVDDMPILYYTSFAGSADPVGDPVGDLSEEIDTYQMFRNDGDDVIVWEQHPDGMLVDVTDKADAMAHETCRENGYDMPEWLYDGKALAEQIEEARLDAEHIRQESWRAI